jgi:dTDP-4-dehydrorhamnose reductase
MVGRAVSQYCLAQGDSVSALDHKTLDISDHSKVRSALQRLQPEIVINCAAWTDVDGCESDQERAFAANATGPQNLAEACALLNARFVTISTDYVFDGLKDGFYTEDDPPNPQSVYGISKLEGELHSLEETLKLLLCAVVLYLASAGGIS